MPLRQTCAPFAMRLDRLHGDKSVQMRSNRVHAFAVRPEPGQRDPQQQHGRQGWTACRRHGVSSRRRLRIRAVENRKMQWKMQRRAERKERQCKAGEDCCAVGAAASRCAKSTRALFRRKNLSVPWDLYCCVLRLCIDSRCASLKHISDIVTARFMPVTRCIGRIVQNCLGPRSSVLILQSGYSRKASQARRREGQHARGRK